MDALHHIASQVQRQFGWYSAVELLLGLGVLVLAFVAPHLGRSGATRLEAALSRPALLAPAGSLLAVGLLALVLRGVLLPWLAPGQPAVHDEQSLLLQAQTLMLGKLAMPASPFWEHFETFHVNQLPAYASVYFPGRSAPLALGLLLADTPWVGVWLSTVALALATVWMLRAWVPPAFALLGGVLVVLRFGVFSYWVNTFWGGSFTALGAMLVIGALPRLLQRASWKHGAVLGAGAAILALTRPYEGLLLCLPVAGLLGLRMVRSGAPGAPRKMAGALVPAVLLVAGAAALLAAHNVATTGRVGATAYGVNRATYSEAPAFLVAPPIRSQERGPAHMRAFYEEEARPYARRLSVSGWLLGATAKVAHTWSFYIGPILTLPFLAGLWAVRRERFLLAALGLFIAGYLLETWNFPHYTAPIMPLLMIVLCRGFMALRDVSWRGRPIGQMVTRAAPLAVLAALALPFAQLASGRTLIEDSRTQVCCVLGTAPLKWRIEQTLRAQDGDHLVMVRSGAHNPVHYEVVYNEPDLDRSRIVWARNLDGASDARLQASMPHRRVWQFDWRPDLPEGHTMVEVVQAGGNSSRSP